VISEMISLLNYYSNIKMLRPSGEMLKEFCDCPKVSKTYRPVRYFLLVIFLFPFISFAQPKKANLIIVPTWGSIETIYKKTIVILIHNGFTIEKSSDDLRTIVTGPKVIDEGTTINLQIFIKDSSELYLSGNTFIPNVGLFPIEHIGMKDSPARVSWEELHRMAKLLKVGGTELTYKME
jgi:hypothetical protein